MNDSMKLTRKTLHNHIRQRQAKAALLSFQPPTPPLQEPLYEHMPRIHAFLSNLLRIELLTNLYNTDGRC